MPYCLTSSLFFLLTQMHAHTALFQTRRQQWCHLRVLWSHAVVWLSQPQCWACCLEEKPALGRSYLDRLKNPCPAVYISQQTASVMVPPDTPLLYCITASLFLSIPHPSLFIWMPYLLCLSVSTLLILPLIFIFAAISL